MSSRLIHFLSATHAHAQTLHLTLTGLVLDRLEFHALPLHLLLLLPSHRVSAILALIHLPERTPIMTTPHLLHLLLLLPSHRVNATPALALTLVKTLTVTGPELPVLHALLLLLLLLLVLLLPRVSATPALIPQLERTHIILLPTLLHLLLLLLLLVLPLLSAILALILPPARTHTTKTLPPQLSFKRRRKV